MRNKIFLPALACGLALLLAACAGPPAAQIVLVPGGGGVEDGSFNEGLWEGVRLFAGVHGKTGNYFQPANTSPEALEAALEQGAESSADVVILAGGDYAALAADAAAQWPDAHFLLMDAAPQGEFAPNLVAVTFAAEQSGYLAGWAAVAEGYTRLGFLGGAPLSGVTSYGFGFVQGANAAARALEVQDVSLRYAYAGGFEAGPEVQERAASWYQEGIEVIFACGGAMNQSVFTAAEQEQGWAIGCDRDQSHLSGRVLFSALKDVGAATGRLLEAHYAGDFPGGQEVHMDLADGVVGLALENSRLEHYTQEDYEQQLSLFAEVGVLITLTDAQGGAPASPLDLAMRLPFVELHYEG